MENKPQIIESNNQLDMGNSKNKEQKKKMETEEDIDTNIQDENINNEPVMEVQPVISEDQKKRDSVRDNWRNYTREQFVEVMSDNSSVVCDELCKYISSMNDEQMQIVFPLMSNERIKKAIPSLQLQQQGIAVLSLNPNQVKVAVSAITASDKQLLLQNISLLTMSETKASENEDLQSIIGFIDPLAMAVAAENPKLVAKVIEASCIMTGEQIKVLVPLLNGEQVKQVLEVIESNEIQKIVLSMMTDEQKETIAISLKEDLDVLQKKLNEEIAPLIKIENDDKLKLLELNVKEFCSKDSTSICEDEYNDHLDNLNVFKKSIETGQRESRYIQNKIKVPLCILDKSNQDLLDSFNNLSIEVTNTSSKLLQQYQIIDKGNLKDGLIHTLNEKWELIKPNFVKETTNNVNTNDIDANDSELVFMDCDTSVALYEAIKSIGNPATIGDIYKITWNEIIEYGFRTEEDFKRNEIATLKDLEEHIAKLKVPKAITESGEAVIG